MRQNQADGVAFEHQAIATLLWRGHKVAVPVTDDDGVDLVVDYRTTVQVKMSTLHDITPGDRYHYRFHVFTSARRNWNADVFLLCGYDEDSHETTWWVVPGEVLRSGGAKESISVYLREGRSRWSNLLRPYVDAWEIFEDRPAIPQLSLAKTA